MTIWQKSEGCFFIAEIGVNHNGDLDLAMELIEIGARAGADAVKFQTFSAEKLVTTASRKAAYQEQNEPDKDETQFEMLKRLELSDADLRACKAHCEKEGILFLSTPFDQDSAILLTDVGVNGFKISSGDLTNLPFLKFLAMQGLPLILSTGMGSLVEVAEAVETIERAGAPPLALLHCVSNYPAKAEDCNLAAIDTLAQAFGVTVGWSDHTLGDAISIAAVARGATIIEKHYTIDKTLPGPDHAASLSPQELTEMITKIRAVESAIGDGVKRPRASEMDTISVARRSLVTSCNIKRGETIQAHMLACKRPGSGIEPKHLERVVGRVANIELSADHVLSWEDLRR